MKNEIYETVEISYKDNFAINFLYGCSIGRIFLRLFITPPVSKLFGFLADRRISSFLIRGFVKRNNINMKEYKDAKYPSFNAFFVREIKKEFRPFPNGIHDLASPCDGKLTAYPINADSLFQIKNSVYSVAGLLKDKSLADEYVNGVCLIFRLTPDDYHRYYYIDDGEKLSSKRIKGALHTVRPISHEHYKVYKQNSREYAVIQTQNFGKVVQMEVGALFVGRIVNHKTERAFKRGDEKGMFEFGGSTIVMLFQENTITLDTAIYENTLQNKETIVRMGNKIGEKTMRGKEKAR